MHSRTPWKKISYTLITSTAIGLATSQSVAAASLYSITDLGTFGGQDSYASSINDAGQVVGYAALSSGLTHAFLYSSSSLQDLGTLSGVGDSLAFGINNFGQVVGYSTFFPNIFTSIDQAFLYSDGLQNLDVFGGQSSFAYSINNKGEVVGLFGEGLDGPDHAFLYTNGRAIDLSTFGGRESVAFSINNSSQVVGSASTVDGPSRAFLYEGGVLQDLGTGPGSDASSINDRGQVVGSLFVASNGPTHAFLKDKGLIQDLGTLYGSSSRATSINNDGQVVGNSDFPNGSSLTCPYGNSHAFIYSNGVMNDLNSLVPNNSNWEITFANGINDRGQIVADGLRDCTSHALLLTPTASVPEPCSNSDILIFGMLCAFFLPKYKELSLSHFIRSVIACL